MVGRSPSLLAGCRIGEAASRSMGVILQPASRWRSQLTSEMGLVSRVSSVQTAMRNCTRDEGKSFEVGNQVFDLKPPPARIRDGSACRFLSRCRAPRWHRAAAMAQVRAQPVKDRLAKSDPGNAGWQRDLSVSYINAGDVQVAQGDLAGALTSYRDSRRELAADPAGRLSSSHAAEIGGRAGNERRRPPRERSRRRLD
jgi:hypothetical protein